MSSWPSFRNEVNTVVKADMRGYLRDHSLLIRGRNYDLGLDRLKFVFYFLHVSPNAEYEILWPVSVHIYISFKE